MLYFDNLQTAADYFKALSSPTRIQIVQLLSLHENMSVNDIARQMGLSDATVSLHIKQLVDCGLVRVRSESGTHGMRKLCSLKEDKMMVDLTSRYATSNIKQISIGVGHYSNYHILPTCLLVGPNGVIGDFDDARYFAFPQHHEAGMVCFGHGYLEYNLPNLLDEGETPKELQLSFEISSEAPGHNDNYPSDIHFAINGFDLGFWTSPGDYGEKKGLLNPPWYPDAFNQYGQLKILMINSAGTFIDGNTKISDITIKDLNLHFQSRIDLRIASPEDAQNPGGVTLFGKGFGNYDQDIIFKMIV